MQRMQEQKFGRDAMMAGKWPTKSQARVFGHARDIAYPNAFSGARLRNSVASPSLEANFDWHD